MTKNWNEILSLSLASDLEILYKDAVEQAKRSPCLRRKYGVVIAYQDENLGITRHIHGYNQRISRCCNGNLCARERFQASHGEKVEIGAEIHAEQAALINHHNDDLNIHPIFVIACLDGHDREIFGPMTFPCHTCALMVQYAGFNQVFLKLESDKIEAISIWDIIEHREKEWVYRYDT